ncbi:MAG: hypothetical protein IJ679_09065 [Lachnospiraceae bacterium]|nr:hypothetical protein [Lachnospiraceae bacterium]
MSVKGILQSGMFYIDHLSSESETDARDIEQFQIDAPEGQGLSDYLKRYARQEEMNRSMRTYLVRDKETDECVGYFSLKAGLISLNEVEVEVEDSATGETRIEREFDTLPGVELANFAVNSDYIKKYPYQKGVGYVIFKKFIIPMIDAVSENVGVKMVYIFALPYGRLMKRYERYGFCRLSDSQEADLHKRLKPRYDESCKFMYLVLE